ncbi:MAG: TIGR00266 family protein [Planctomycetales bacterium]|nr:TIGR00266 family protein [Planctomycetales bacterium]
MMMIPQLEAEPVIEMAEIVEDADVPIQSPAAAPRGMSQSASPSAAKSSAPTNATLTGSTGNFNYEISQRPDFSIVKLDLPSGGKVFAEPSAMVSMSPSVKLEAGFKGGFGKTLGRMLGGESLIINTFTAEGGPAEVLFAGGAAGDVAYHRLNGNSLYLQRGAYMLNSEGVEVTGKWQGAKGFFSGEGLVLLKASGTGDLFFNSYGAIMPIDVTGGFIVDTGYIVAFEDTLQYRVTVLPGLRAGGKIKSFFFGGEGLVCQFSGTGRVWIQTRQVGSFLSWVHAFRPTKSK